MMLRLRVVGKQLIISIKIIVCMLLVWHRDKYKEIFQLTYKQPVYGHKYQTDTFHLLLYNPMVLYGQPVSTHMGN